MKNILYYLIAIILVTAACTEDKGTYDYVSLNDVVISGIEDNYTALSEKPFSIAPMVEQKMVNDESVLEYLWYAYINGQPYEADTLSFTKDLNLDSLLLDPADYNLVFRVSDFSSGLFYDKRSTISIKGFPDGLQVLSNNANNAQVSVLRGPGASSFEAYKDKNDGAVAGVNPVGIVGMNKFMKYGKPFRIAILCNDANFGTYVTGSTLEKTIDVIDAFGNVAAPSSVTGNIDQGTYASGVFGDNTLYTGYQPGLLGDDVSMMFVLNDVSPVFQAYIPFGGFVLYNPITTGLGETDSWGSRVSFYSPSDNEEAAFDRSNTGLDAIYGKTVGDYAMGVFEDSADSKKYILAILSQEAAFKNEIIGDDIANATIFEFLNSKQVLFYVYGNKIYTYDVVANKVLYTYEAPAGVTIDRIKVSADDKKLFVGMGDGTNAASSGSVHILNVDLDGEILGVHEAYDNKFGKVVDFYENY